jgi:glycosyltransferase involved in cell wall biosynthesis
MRVCHVSPHLPPDQAANALLPAELGEWTRAAGGEVTFVTHEAAQGGQSPGQLPGPVHRVPRRRRGSGPRRWLRLDALDVARQVARALDAAAGDADVVHLHSNGLIVEAAAAWARRRGRPHLLTLYGTEIWHYRRRWPIDPFTRAYRRAGAVTFYSRGLLDAARRAGLDRSGLRVVYPAVRGVFAARDEAGRALLRQSLGIVETRLLLNVKRLHELAGQEFLIHAFAQVVSREEDVRLVICGTGPLRAPLEAQARRLGIDRKVTFTGLIDNDRVAAYAAAADAFVLPSLLEALPTVAVEALASGTPVISADHPGGLELHELFGDDVQVLPRRDGHALAQAIESRLAHPRRVHPRTFDIIRERFSPEAVHGAYREVYAQLAPGRSRG